MIQNFFDATCDTYRITGITGTDNEQFELKLEDISCHIQPLDDVPNEDLDGSAGKDFVMFCPVKDIIEGDKVISGGIEYLVRGIEKYDFMGESHLELRIRKSK